MDIGYKKEYRIRFVAPGKKAIEVSMPYQVIAREAEKRDMTVKQFIENFVAVAEYDNFDGIRYTFKEVEGDASPV